jgi:hypothetical protein
MRPRAVVPSAHAAQRHQRVHAKHYYGRDGDVPAKGAERVAPGLVMRAGEFAWLGWQMSTLHARNAGRCTRSAA